MRTNRKGGFTLIELLVVIAIIGVLSAVVLASLNSARSKGNDAGVKANLSTVATQAALFVTENSNSYGVFDNGDGAPGDCPVPGTSGTTVFHNSTIESAIAAALKDASAGGAASCMSSASAFAVAVSRPTDVATTTSALWCVDSTGEHCGIDALSGTSCGSCVTRQ